MPGKDVRTAVHRLEVVVDTDCPGCAEARHLADQMQKQFPAVEVNVIHVGDGQPIPRGVVATPTYLLDGKIFSIGNPYREALARALAQLGPPGA